MDYQNLLIDTQDGIATVTINRPKAMNALNSETLAEIGRLFERMADDPLIRGVIITGSGSKAFVAGADIAELATKNPTTGRRFVQAGQAALHKIEQLPKPVIAAVNGFALGGGCELAMACHIRIAASTARFGQPEVGLGLIPGFGGTQRLPRLVGKGRGLELMLSGAMIGADEAYRIGLVNRVVEAFQKDDKGNPTADEKGRPVFDREAFLAEVKRILQQMLNNAPLALRYVMEAVNRGLDGGLRAGLQSEADLFGLLYDTQDAKEGLSAYLEKRKADFKGE